MVRKILVSIGGSFLIALGLVGTILPVMPGVVFIVAGLWLMSNEFQWADNALQRARAWLDRQRDRDGAMGEGERQTPH